MSDVDTPTALYPAQVPGYGYGDDVRASAYAAYVRLDGNMSAVCREFGIRYDTLLKWKQRDDWVGRIRRTEQELTETARRAVKKTLRELAPEALASLREIMHHAVLPDGSIDNTNRRLAATALLDRAGYSPTHKLQIKTEHVGLNVDATVRITPEEREDAIATLQAMLARDRALPAGDED